ncbi:MAG: alpha-L-arabinofuranosidase C-terminal domain-containing protein [Acidobacteriota bacterium]
MKPRLASLLTLLVLFVASAASFAAPEPPPAASLTIDAATPVGRVSPMHYGLMTEEINYCYDGGLYAELVRNRAFRDNPEKPVHWSAVGAATLALDSTVPLNSAIPGSLRLEIPEAGGGVANAGYWGMPLTPSTRYLATVHAKATAGFAGPLTVSLQSGDGATVYARARIDRLVTDWQAHEVMLETQPGITPTTDARLVISADKPGTVWLGFVSLFPPTWKDRPNGLRRDLMQMLVDLKPAFLRFPGGNYLEGGTIDQRFKWWKTLGPIHERPGHEGTWGYRSTDGMGLMEFLLWCEDMGAEPVLGLYAGYSLNGEYIKSGPALEPFIQESLDEIEYVVGPVTSKWGARRAADGHPAPFKLHYVEIGNEDAFDKSGSYDGRYAQFHDAIKARYPRLKCISSIGNDQSAKLVKSRRPDVLDEHNYSNAADFIRISPTHFDNYDRSGPEVFVGEWAAHETPFKPWDKESKDAAPTPNFMAALGDAAWMAAMERVSDLVTMQCYAPMLANVNEHQWRPNLIGYDALRAYGSPSYHAFKLFSTHVGDEILKPVFSAGSPLQASVTRDRRSGVLYLKIVNPEASAQTLRIELQGVHDVTSFGRAHTLAAAPDATNTLAQPVNVVPVITKLSDIAPTFTHQIAAHSITLLELKAR